MANACGCVDNVLYDKADVCGPDEVHAKSCVDNLKENFDPSRDCYCPNICDGVNYEIMTSRLEWPTKRSFPQFTASVYTALSRDYNLKTYTYANNLKDMHNLILKRKNFWQKT